MTSDFARLSASDSLPLNFGLNNVLGDSRKYPYHTTDSFHILTPPLACGIYKVRYPPMPSDFHTRKTPLPFRFSIFSSDPSRFTNLPNWNENFLKNETFSPYRCLTDSTLVNFTLSQTATEH